MYEVQAAERWWKMQKYMAEGHGPQAHTYGTAGIVPIIQRHTQLAVCRPSRLYAVQRGTLAVMHGQYKEMVYFMCHFKLHSSNEKQH